MLASMHTPSPSLDDYRGKAMLASMHTPSPSLDDYRDSPLLSSLMLNNDSDVSMRDSAGDTLGALPGPAAVSRPPGSLSAFLTGAAGKVVPKKTKKPVGPEGATTQK